MDLLESDDVAAALGSPLREANRPDELSMAASPAGQQRLALALKQLGASSHCSRRRTS